MRGLAVLFAVTTACTTTTTHWRATFHRPDQPPAPHEAQFLEVHTPTGNLYVLGDWRLAVDTQVVHGTGLFYDARRVLRSRGTFEIPWSEISLFQATGAEAIEVESVSPYQTFFIAVLAGLGALVGLVVVAVALNPPGA